jgi:hypothetical protein
MIVLALVASCAAKPVTRVDAPPVAAPKKDIAPPQEGPRCAAIGQPKEKPVDLVFVSTVDDFMFRVPYSDEWQFRCARVNHLNDRADNVFEARWAGGGGWEISVNVVTESKEDSADDAHAYLERVGKDFARVTSLEDYAVTHTSRIFEHHGAPILAIRSEGKRPNGDRAEAWSYWTFRRRADGKILDFHLTLNTGSDHELLEKAALRLLTEFITVTAMQAGSR